jgi:hypothetical protein
MLISLCKLCNEPLPLSWYKLIMYKEKKQTIPLPSTPIDMYNELRTPCSDEYIHRILYKQRDLSTLSSHYSDSNE